MVRVARQGRLFTRNRHSHGLGRAPQLSRALSEGSPELLSRARNVGDYVRLSAYITRAYS